MDDKTDAVWFENHVSASDCRLIGELADGWYTHIQYPIWRGYNPYIFTNGELFEIGEEGYVLVEEAERVKREPFFQGNVWYPITMKYWYGPEKDS